MRYTRIGLVGLAILGGAVIWSALPAQGQPGDAGDARAKLPENVRTILEKNCFECHGKGPKIKGDFNIFNADQLREHVGKEKPDAVPMLWERVSAKDETIMPPAGKPPLAKADLDVIEAWIKESAPPFGDKQLTAAPTSTQVATAVAGDPNLATEVKEIFRQHCFECHGDTNPQNGVKILDYDLLVTKLKKVQPGKLRTSQVFKLMTGKGDNVMPPPAKPRLDVDKIVRVVEWIAAGAPKWGEDKGPVAGADPFFRDKNVIGVDYVLDKIRDDIRQIPQEERRFMRYISYNHLLTKGTTDEQLNTYGKALANAVNHLSFEPDLVRPRPIDGVAAVSPNVRNQGGSKVAPPPGQTTLPTIYCIDLRRLGWATPCFDAYSYDDYGQAKYLYRDKYMNLYDLALLEYPYSTMYSQSHTYQELYDVYMKYAQMARPIPYVRADWFCSVCTQPPLYEDMLQLPLNLYEMEARLNVNAEDDYQQDKIQRAGMTVSGVSRNNRIVERHRAAYGYYWKSLDFKTSKGEENMFRDPLFPEIAGGEMIFSLPNHMQGYYVTNNKGDRIEEAITAIVTDKFASDKTVRTGLACIRCHDQGVKPFQDTVRTAYEKKNQALLPFSPQGFYDKVLAIYPPQELMQKNYIDPDKEQFRAAYQRYQDEAPPQVCNLTPVSQKFLDDPINLAQASAELGIRRADVLEKLFLSPQFAALGVLSLGAGGDIRRDSFEDYYDQLTTGLGLGYPIIPLDGLTRPDYASRRDLEVIIKVVDDKGKTQKTFKPGDKYRLVIDNKSKYDVYCELVSSDIRGEKAIQMPCTTLIRKGSKLTIPAANQPAKPVDALKGREDLTMYYSNYKFPPGRVYRLNERDRKGYKWVADRVVHPFYTDIAQGQYQPGFDPRYMCKKTISVVTE
jgi:serine/threonine-protein kinase